MDEQSPRGREKSGYLSEDTVAAVATALGGPVAIIRVSGPLALQSVSSLAGKTAKDLEPRKLVRATLHSPDGRVVDDALFVCFISPESFTGEDVVEYHVHGGSFVATRLLELLKIQGIRQALPGEFSFRAVRNGKMSITQAEAVSDLISATNESAVTLALEKMSGSQNLLIQDLAQNLRQLVVLGEAGIDFSDQDLDELSLPQLKKKIAPLLGTLVDLESGFSRGMKIQEGVRVAFVGLPNAGKSSFFNALLGQDRSIVSEIPGTTRDVVSEKLTLRGRSASVTLLLEDTAGLRKSSDLIENLGIERSEKSAKGADLILFLADPTGDLGQMRVEWAALKNKVSNLNVKTIGIITKVDAVSLSERASFLNSCREFAIESWIQTSALRGEGISESVDAILVACEKHVHRGAGEVLLTRLDHLDSVQGAIRDLERADKAVEIDLFAADLKQALHSLSPIIGETLTDDILGKIFSDFCIGK